jgi:hypothetical protein
MPENGVKLSSSEESSIMEKEPTPKQYLSRADASDHLKRRGLRVAPSTLAKLAVVGGGPPFVKFLSRAFYEPQDLDEWAANRMSPKRSSTSMPAAALSTGRTIE